MKSFLSHLECTVCGKYHDADLVQNFCDECGRVLYPVYDLEGARRAVSKIDLLGRSANMWRFFEIMPVRSPDNVVTLGEGVTPLLRADKLGRKLGCSQLFLKDEGMNPTGSFKARGLSAAVSRAVELGQRRVAMPSAGNAGGALAAYGSRAGIDCFITIPEETPQAAVTEVRLYGSRLELVAGHIGDAGRIARERAGIEGLFDLSTMKEPYRVEGKKTMGYELAADFNWTVPDVVVYPTGGGTGLLGIWKAFEEMTQLGWLEEAKMPRMICVQSEGCAPITRAYLEGKDRSEPWVDPITIASGLRVPTPFADDLILQTVRESGGTALTVGDEELYPAIKDIAELEGVFVCPEGAATLVALQKLLEMGTIDPDEKIVLLNTGTGLKYLDVLETP